VVKDLGCKAEGEVDIDFHKLSQFTRGELFGWLAAYTANIQAKQPEPAPPPVVELPRPVPVKPVEEDDSDLRQRALDEAEGKARVEYYIHEEGLEDNLANGQIIIDFIKAHGGRWTAAVVDKAIAAKGDRLVWRRKAVELAKPEPAKPAPAEPAEVLGTLPNGERQLPLNADDRTMRAASVTQLKDYLARTRAAK
jgi:hypothetical protein